MADKLPPLPPGASLTNGSLPPLPTGASLVTSDLPPLPQGASLVKPDDTSWYEDLWSGAKATGAFVGDFVNFLPKQLAQTAVVGAAKLAAPGYSIDELNKAAGAAFEQYMPSFGHGLQNDPRAMGTYNVANKPFELAGQVLNKPGDIALEHNLPNVGGALHMVAPFVPIPGVHAVGKGVGKVLEKIDPGLRNAGKTTAAQFQDNLNKNVRPENAQPSVVPPEDIPRLLETNPGEVPSHYGYQGSPPMSPSQLKEWADRQERFKQYAEGTSEQQRYATAQAIIDARQQALEQDVARQRGLDFNAAERARQEAAPTGYDAWVEAQRQAAEQRIPGDNEPMNFNRPLTGRTKYSKGEQGNKIPEDVTLRQKQPGQENLTNEPYHYEGGIDAPELKGVPSTLPLEVQDIINRGMHEQTLPQQVLELLQTKSPEQLAKEKSLPIDILEILNTPKEPPPHAPWAKPIAGLTMGKSGRQRGVLDMSAFTEGFKGLNKWLSKLTDEPWVRQRFPASLYESNQDGTPRIMLHGSIARFNDTPKAKSLEGFHAGYAGPAHMKASIGVQEHGPQRTYLDQNKLRAGYTANNLKYGQGENVPAHQDLGGGAIYPVVIRKGNYPHIQKTDLGSFDPSQLQNQTRFLQAVAKASNGRYGFYDVKEIMDNWWSSAKNMNDRDMILKSWSRMLKDQLGIDGFYYKNGYESANRKAHLEAENIRNRRWHSALPTVTTRTNRLNVLAKKLDSSESFVTWDNNNIRSLYDEPIQSTTKTGALNKGPRGKQRGAVDPQVIKDLTDMITRAARAVIDPIGLGKTVADHLKKATGIAPGRNVIVQGDTGEKVVTNVGVRDRGNVNNTNSGPLITGTLPAKGRSGLYQPRNSGSSWEPVVDVKPVEGSGPATRHTLDEVTLLGGKRGSLRQGFGGKQSGKVDFGGIVDEFNKLADKIKSAITKEGSTPLPKTPEDHLRNLPGMGKEGSAIIAKGRRGEDIVADTHALFDKLQAAGQPIADSKLWENFQSGAGHIAEKLRDIAPWTLELSRWYDYGKRMQQLAVRKYAQPLEKMLIKTSLDEKNQLLIAFKHGMLELGEHVPVEKLLENGMSPKAAKAYSEFIKQFDILLERKNEALRAIGEKELTKQDAYMNSLFHGDWHTFVRDKNGKMLWPVHSPTKAHAELAAKWLREHFKDNPNVDINSLEVKHSPSVKGIPRDYMGAYSKILEYFKDSEVSDQVRAALADYIKQIGSNTLGQEKFHTNVKINARGFEGDKPWLSEKVNANSFLLAQLNYIENGHTWAARQEIMNEAKKVLSDERINKEQPQAVALAKQILMQQMGISQNMFRGVETALGSKYIPSVALGKDFGISNLKDLSITQGHSAQALPNAVGTLRGAAIFAMLGFSPGYWMATPLQAINGAMGWYSKLKLEGKVKSNPVQFIGDILEGTVSAVTMKHGFSDFAKEYLDWAETNNVAHTIPFDEYRGFTMSMGMRVAKNLTNYTISRPDQLTRIPLSLSLAHAMWRSGAYETKAKAFQEAAELTNQVMIPIRREDRPLGVDKAGVVGDMSYLFASPLVAMWNTIALFGGKMEKNNPKTWLPLLTLLGAMAVMSGIHNMPVVDEAEKTGKYVANTMSEHFPKAYANLADTKWHDWAMFPKETMISNMDDHSFISQITNWGLASALTGVNMSTRFNQGVFDPNDPYGRWSPLTQEPAEWRDATLGVLHNDRHSWANAVHTMSPPLVKGLMETMLPEYKTAIQPDPSTGLTNYRNPNQPRNEDLFVQRNQEETRARMMGVTALSEAQRKSKTLYSLEEQHRRQTAIKKLMPNLWYNAVEGNQKEVVDYATAYEKLDPGGTMMSAFITEHAAKLGMTPEQVIASKAGQSIQSALTAARRARMDQGNATKP